MALAFVSGLILGCSNGAGPPNSAVEQAERGAAIASPQTGPGARAQAKAELFAQQAVTYEKMAANRRAVSTATNVLSPLTAATATFGTSSRRAARTDTLAALAARDAKRRSDHAKVAALADQLAANAQRAADLYRAQASELSGEAGGGGAQ